MADDRMMVAVLLSSFTRAYEVAESLSSKRLETIAIENADGLSRLLSCRRVDVVVVEQRLSGFLTGLEILQRLDADLFHPSTILVGPLTPAQAASARKLGIKLFVEEDPGASTFKAAVISRLQQCTVTQSSIPYQVKKLVSEAEIVPPLPQLLTRLCSYLRDEAASPQALAEELSVDPRIAVELLRITNASAHGLATKVTSLPEAVSMLGIRRTVSTVLSTAVVRSQSDMMRRVPETVRSWYHSRSVLIASTASAFAARRPLACPETARVLGLVQDVGVLVLADTERRAYEGLLRRFKSVGYVRLEGLEREEFGMSHAEVSAAVLERWGIPQILVSLVLDHHPPEKRKDPSEADRQYLDLMRIAEAAANFSEVPCAQRKNALTTLLCRAGGGRPSPEDRACIAQGLSSVAEFGKLYSTAPPDGALVRNLADELERLGEPVDPQLLGSLPPVESDGSTPGDGEASTPADETRTDVPQGARDDERNPTPADRSRVLFVDDEEAVVRLATRMLASSGFELIASRSAEEAAAHAAGVDLVLCDVHLAGESGLDVLRQLRSAGNQAPVIMVSGDRSRETVVECIDTGIVDYIVKPFTRAGLIEKINKHLKPRLVESGA